MRKLNYNYHHHNHDNDDNLWWGDGVGIQLYVHEGQRTTSGIISVQEYHQPRDLPLAWSLWITLGWLANKPWVSFFPFLSSGITGTQHHIQHFSWVLGNFTEWAIWSAWKSGLKHTIVLCSSQMVGKRPNSRPSCHVLLGQTGKKIKFKFWCLDPE